MSMDINRILNKIRILEEVLETGYFIIIAEGDPDFPQGLKFPLPKTWKSAIKKAIRDLKAQLKNLVDQYAAQG